MCISVCFFFFKKKDMRAVLHWSSKSVNWKRMCLLWLLVSRGPRSHLAFTSKGRVRPSRAHLQPLKPCSHHLESGGTVGPRPTAALPKGHNGCCFTRPTRTPDFLCSFDSSAESPSQNAISHETSRESCFFFGFFGGVQHPIIWHRMDLISYLF